jgi:hypothetical protein
MSTLWPYLLQEMCGAYGIPLYYSTCTIYPTWFLSHKYNWVVYAFSSAVTRTHFIAWFGKINLYFPYPQSQKRMMNLPREKQGGILINIDAFRDVSEVERRSSKARCSIDAFRLQKNLKTCFFLFTYPYQFWRSKGSRDKARICLLTVW